MAIFNLITFFIHAIVGAMASMLRAVFTHVVPALVVLLAVLAIVALVCTSCGVGGFALLRRSKRED